MHFNSVDPVKRFFDRVEMIPFHTCWEWVGCKDKDGYGVLWFNRKNIRAHRFSVSLKEKLIPGMFVDHKCRNRSCVNPAHLHQVTPRQNVLFNSNAPTARLFAQTHCKRGHEFNSENCRLNVAGARECIICRKEAAKKYNSMRKLKFIR